MTRRDPADRQVRVFRYFTNNCLFVKQIHRMQLQSRRVFLKCMAVLLGKDRLKHTAFSSTRRLRINES